MPLQHSINLAWRLDKKSGGNKFLSSLCVGMEVVWVRRKEKYQLARLQYSKKKKNISQTNMKRITLIQLYTSSFHWK